MTTQGKQPPTNEEQWELIQRWRGGDESAFRELVDRNAGLLRYFIRHSRLFPTLRLRFDVVIHELTIAVWRAARSYQPEKGRFCTYLVWYLRGTLKDLRRRVTQDRAEQLTCTNMDLDLVPEQEDELARNPLLAHPRAERLLRAVHTLPAVRKTVVERVYGLNGHPPQSVREIAPVLGLSKSRVHQLLDDSLLALRRKVGA